MRTALAILVLAVAASAAAGLRPVRSEPKFRLGTYDGRAIAVAFAPSRFNPAAQKVAERDAAQKAGDEKRVAELEAWGRSFQRHLHRQAFAHMFVDDLLEPVRAGVERVAHEQGLAVIAQRCDYTAADVELVDVTDALVALFEPSAKTLQTVAAVRAQAPLDLDEVERDHEH